MSNYLYKISALCDFRTYTIDISVHRWDYTETKYKLKATKSVPLDSNLEPKYSEEGGTGEYRLFEKNIINSILVYPDADYAWAWTTDKESIPEWKEALREKILARLKFNKEYAENLYNRMLNG